MLIEIASLIIINTRAIDASIDNNNLGNNNSGYNYFVPGDSRLQIEQREREAAERVEQARQEAIAREEAKRASRGGSTGTGGNAIKLYQDFTNNCAVWAKKQTGINHPIGAGGRASIQGQEPKIGAIAVEKGYAHASVVKEVRGNTIIINESNYIKGWITQREVAISNFYGFIYN